MTPSALVELAPTDKTVLADPRFRFAHQHPPSCVEETREGGYQNGIDELDSLPPLHHAIPAVIHAVNLRVPPFIHWVHWVRAGLFPLGFLT
jgi:hypothetical protein